MHIYIYIYIYTCMYVCMYAYIYIHIGRRAAARPAGGACTFRGRTTRTVRRLRIRRLGIAQSKRV